MGDLFAVKSQMLAYENVMGHQRLSDKASASEFHEFLARNAERYANLPVEKRSLIDTQYRRLEDQTRITFGQKFNKMLTLLFVETPPLVQAWILFSLVIPLLLLLRIEGSAYVVWLLPLITLTYAIDNRLYETPVRPNPEAAIFPSEDYLLTRYVKEPLDSNIFIQQEQLKKGWQLYLVEEWANEIPASDPVELARQAEKGEFAFNIERLLKMGVQKESVSTRHQESLWILGIYLLWNLFFAWVTCRHCKFLHEKTAKAIGNKTGYITR